MTDAARALLVQLVKLGEGERRALAHAADHEANATRRGMLIDAYLAVDEELMRLDAALCGA